MNGDAGWAGRPRLLLLASGDSCSAPNARADEDALQTLWKQQLATPDEHEALIKACHDYAAANAGDPFLPVARGFEEWHLLRANRRPEALQMMTAGSDAPHRGR